MKNFEKVFPRPCKTLKKVFPIGGGLKIKLKPQHITDSAYRVMQSVVKVTL